MRVGKYYMIYHCRIEHQVAVHAVRFQSFALEHSAVEQDFLPAIGGYQVFASGYFPGSADKFDFHSTVGIDCLDVIKCTLYRFTKHK
jgi:hypothetical protein